MFKFIFKICLTGPRCEIEVDECESNPCHNGVCDDLVGDFKCECISGFYGRLCEYDYDECSSNPCKNGGTCQNLQVRFKQFCVVAVFVNDTAVVAAVIVVTFSVIAVAFSVIAVAFAFIAFADAVIAVFPVKLFGPIE